MDEFGKSFEHYYAFSGLPPENHTTTQHQLKEFSRQLAENFKTPFAPYQDWGDAFWATAEQVKTGKTLLLFDEISWMGSKDSTFLGKIKNFWDQYLKKNDHLIFIVCGSASAWIEKNILNSTGFVGRISYTLTLEELSLIECNQFWPDHISAFEKLKILSVIGGIPKYLEEINPNISAEENIKRLCFTRGGFLVGEFKRIFSDLFLRHSEYYYKILEILASGGKQKLEIQKMLKIQHEGRLFEYLWELEQSGFITRDYTWSIRTGKDKKISKYRLSDNYCRFYLKYIAPNLRKIERSTYDLKSLTSLPEWNSMMGFQFESLVLSNRKFLHACLTIQPGDIVSENPFYQRKTARYPGCQIDYMIQTQFNTLYIFEIKFSKKEIGESIIQEVSSKIKALKYPKGYSCRPVLVHVNGVSENIIDSNFFAHIIDMSTLLDHPSN